MEQPIKHPLKQVRISGYKSISKDHPLTLDVSNVTLLIGPNGAGKSNIVSFFKMLGNMMRGHLQLYVERTGTNSSSLYYGPKVTPQLEAAIEVGDDTDFERYQFRMVPAQPDRLIIAEETAAWGTYAAPGEVHPIPLEPNYKESALALEASDAHLQTLRSVLSNCKVYQFHDSSSAGPLRQPSPVDAAPYLQSDGCNLASFLYYLQREFPASYAQIVRYVRSVVPQFKDFFLQPNERGYISLRWVDNSLTDYVLNVNQFSDGSIRFVALATLLLQPAGTMSNVIIIDEPELGLHPFAVSQLTEMIQSAAVHAQVIVATQSPDLLDGFEVEDVRVIERDETNECTLLHTLDRATLQGWLESYSLSELWEKNVVGGNPL
jgi:predicted ATPase